MITKIPALIALIGFAATGTARAQSPAGPSSPSQSALEHDAAKENHTTTIKDIGPKPQSFDLENATRANTNFRTTAWTGRYLQMTLMSIPAGGEIGWEVHSDGDQFIRLDGGHGRVQMGESKDRITFDQEVSDGWCVLIPAGIGHNVINIGNEPMQLYVIYAPPEHEAGKIHKTAADAAADHHH
jgi:mannose-6-phosphate isomerase-like protein (cupin superfamily)